MSSMDIMADLPVAGTFRCHDYSNKALQCKLTVAKTCTRDRKRQQEALHLMPNMVSCALHTHQPSGLKVLVCPCRMAVLIQEKLTEHCSSTGSHTNKCRKPAHCPQWQRPLPRAASLCRGHAGHYSAHLLLEGVRARQKCSSG